MAVNYIKNKNLIEELKKCRDGGKKTEELGRMILLIAKKYSEKGNFCGYSWKDDMVGEAVLTCMKYMHNFDVDRDQPNPFAYFSLIIHRSFLTYIMKQKKHSKIKDICYNNVDFILPEKDFVVDYEHHDISAINYQMIRGNKKRKKRKKKKEEKK